MKESVKRGQASSESRGCDGSQYFPSQENISSLLVFDGNLWKKNQDITITRPGYYGIYLLNKSPGGTNRITLGLTRCRIACEYKLFVPASQDAIHLSHGTARGNLRNSPADELSTTKSEIHFSDACYGVHSENDENGNVWDISSGSSDDHPLERRSDLLELRKELRAKSTACSPPYKVIPKGGVRPAHSVEWQRTLMFSNRQETCESKFGHLPTERSTDIWKKNGRKAAWDCSQEFVEGFAASELSSMLSESDNSLICHTSNSRTQSQESLRKSGLITTEASCSQCAYLYVPSSGCCLNLYLYSSMSLGFALMCECTLKFCSDKLVIPRKPLVPFPRGVAILSLDGGGVLALSSLKILERLELEIRKESGVPNARIIDCFDLVAGTSAGGIIALGLLSGKSLNHLIHIWTRMSARLFAGNRGVFSGLFSEGYELEKVKKEFINAFGDTFMNSYSYPYGFVTTTDVKHNPYQLFLIRNYERKRHCKLHGNDYRGCSEFPIWTAAWATSAAPTYFKGPHSTELERLGFCIEPKIHLVDGALKANNPTIVALEEASHLVDKSIFNFIEENLDLIVSIGTGQLPVKLTQSASRGNASTLEIVLNLGQLLTSANKTHREVLNWLAHRENTYWRFNVPHIGELPLDTIAPHHVDMIIRATEEYLIDEKFYEIRKLSRVLAGRLKR